jgi:general secretion pathway protein B
MSSILDALRKLDEQKHVRKQGPVDIAAGVVRPSVASPPFRVRPWQVGVLLLLVAGGSVGITMLVMRPQQPSSVDSKASPALPPPVVTQTVPSPTVPLPASTPQTPPASASASMPAVVDQGAVQRQVKAPPATAPKPVVQPALTPVPITEPLMAGPSQPVTMQPANPLPVASLKLTGIGWQKEASARYAVINGTAVGEGSMVDGAKVEEILPEKVRLKVDGKMVEIDLGK